MWHRHLACVVLNTGSFEFKIFYERVINDKKIWGI
jgi:hypothetical protein